MDGEDLSIVWNRQTTEDRIKMSQTNLHSDPKGVQEVTKPVVAANIEELVLEDGRLSN